MQSTTSSALEPQSSVGPVSSRGWRRFLFRGPLLHPLWRALLFLVLWLLVDPILNLLITAVYALVLLATGHPPAGVGAALQAVQTSGVSFLLLGVQRLLKALGLALLLGYLVDREPPETMGLAPVRWARDGGLGVLFGAGAMVVVGLSAWMFSPARVILPGQITVVSLLTDGVAFLAAAAAEEIVFRGYLQRLFTNWGGPWVGIAVPSVLFALFHGLNPHVTPLALVNIGLAGVVFALAVRWTGTLWLAVGYHFAWNLFQGAVLGLPVSGVLRNGLLAFPTDGPPILTGGPFGPEGGLVVTMLLLLSLLPLWAVTRRPAITGTAMRHQQTREECESAPFPQPTD